MDFSSLEIFCTVAAEQSITRAAHHLARVQSNVTTRVKQLEEELRVELFSREGRRMTLTPNGRRMLVYAQRLLALAEEAREAMSPDQPAGVLRIGAMESTAATRLPSLLSVYHSRWPQIELEISIGTSCSLIDDVLMSRVDCAFVADAGFGHVPGIGGVAERSGLSATRACTEDMLLVLPPNHPPVKRPEDLQIRTWAAFAKGCSYRSVLERWLGIRNAEHETGWKLMELTSYHTMLACVAARSCFALCPKSVLELQRAPLHVRTQPIAAVDTYLIARSAYSSGAYEALLRAVDTRIRVTRENGAAR
ncbi:LysR family transcriptional regulator [Trinickia violacea]|uniref:LysR family transcriptional regulator n=1 Tax=Trinickia violacea TaxID=2571746 RepID=A0A4P8IYB7_9BURK|nr:LysR substrate-binding domain-containing protein [Trinickia violacea]QCP52965.1 LysR family transcriptional regulator [Trinickia violacea]